MSGGVGACLAWVSARMIAMMWVTHLFLAVLGAVPAAAQSDADPAGPLQLTFDEGRVFVHTQETEIKLTDRVFGMDDEPRGGTLTYRVCCAVEIEITRITDDGCEGRLTPVRFEIVADSGTGSATFKYADGTYTAEAGDGERFDGDPEMYKPRREPYGIRIQRNGMYRFTDSISDHPLLCWLIDPINWSSILGWAGPLPAAPVAAGGSWETPVDVRTAHCDGFPIVAKLKLSGGGNERAEAEGILEVDRRAERYPWMATFEEKSAVKLAIEPDGRSGSLTVEWSARTPNNEPIASYTSAVTWKQK